MATKGCENKMAHTSFVVEYMNIERRGLSVDKLSMDKLSASGVLA